MSLVFGLSYLGQSRGCDRSNWHMDYQHPPAEAQIVSLPGPDGSTLSGVLYLPKGQGPFPAVLWNHGSEKEPSWQLQLAKFYTAQGFAFFLPNRRGHGMTPGEYIMDRQRALIVHGILGSTADTGRKVVALHEEANRDVQAALEWLKHQPEIDPDRIVMSGVSFGGIQTLLTAEKDLGVRAFVAFAPGAMSWAYLPSIGEHLKESVRAAKAPIVILQAENDYDLSPSRTLGEVLKQRGGLNRAVIYPAFGDSHQQGHAGFATRTEGTAIWGPDVLEFFRAALATPAH